MTGTVEVMAIDVLRAVEHTYRNDLESSFYVLLWIRARRAWERDKRKDQAADSVLGIGMGTQKAKFHAS